MNTHNKFAFIICILFLCVNAYGKETYKGSVGNRYNTVLEGSTYNESNLMGVKKIPNYYNNTVNTNITYDNPPSPIIIITETSGCVYDDGVFILGDSVTLDAGNHPSYIWSDGSTTQAIIVFSQGSYTVTVTDSDGSTGTTQTTIEGTDPIYGEEIYMGCTGDPYSVVVNGTTYNEANPTGTETFFNSSNCDSTVNINLIYHFLPTPIVMLLKHPDALTTMESFPPEILQF